MGRTLTCEEGAVRCKSVEVIDDVIEGPFPAANTTYGTYSPPVAVALEDERVIRSFPAYTGPGRPGAITDFLGVRTRIDYLPHVKHLGGYVEGYPIPLNFHATATEWAGVLRAAREAGRSPVAVELGAGWGPWLVTFAVASGARRPRLVGVEGCRPHWEYLRTHFADNGLDPDAFTLLHGIAAPADGWAEFPVLADPAADWGAAALLPTATRRALPGCVRAVVRFARRTVGTRRPRLPTERVRAYSLATLLEPFGRVDLVHIDIQGHEAEVVAAAADVLTAKVRRLVIGTHGRGIEERLMLTLAPRGWDLESDEACRFLRAGTRLVQYMDGCQVWRNDRV
jgi:FkbM family methyltransferase